jgi:hypothetical protein
MCRSNLEFTTKGTRGDDWTNVSTCFLCKDYVRPTHVCLPQEKYPNPPFLEVSIGLALLGWKGIKY